MKSRPVPRCVLKQSVLADMQAGIARRGDLVFQDDKEDHADEDYDPRRGEKDNHYAAGLDEDDT